MNVTNLIIIGIGFVFTFMQVYLRFPYWMHTGEPVSLIGSLLFLCWVWSPYFWLVRRAAKIDRDQQSNGEDRFRSAVFEVVLAIIVIGISVLAWTYARKSPDGYTDAGLALILPLIQTIIILMFSLSINPFVKRGEDRGNILDT